MQGLLSNLFIRWLAEPTDEHGHKAIKLESSSEFGREPASVSNKQQVPLVGLADDHLF